MQVSNPIKETKFIKAEKTAIVIDLENYILI